MSGAYPQITCSTERVLFPAVPWYPLTHLGGTLCLSGGWCSLTGSLISGYWRLSSKWARNNLRLLSQRRCSHAPALSWRFVWRPLLLIAPYHFPGWPGGGWGLLNSLPRQLATNRFIILFLGCGRTQKTESPLCTPPRAVPGFICVYRELSLAHQRAFNLKWQGGK